MRRSGKRLLCGVAVVVIGLTGMSWAQPGGGGGGGGRRGNFDPAQFRQRMMDRVKQQLGATDEEWKVIEPLYGKVMDLQRSTRGRFGFGRRGGRRGGANANNNADQSPVQKAEQELSDLLQNDSATPEQIRAKLNAFRKARDEARQQLIAAQKNLQKVLSLKQEAQLVMMGTLD